MTELHDLLERATDRLAGPDLADRALARAQRRRSVRRGALAAGTAAVLVAAVAVGSQVAGDRGSVGPVAPSPRPTTSPSAPAEDGLPMQEQWDPRRVDRLPARSVPGLPTRIEVPDTAPSLAESPVPSAFLGVEVGDEVLLLGSDGGWRTAPASDRGEMPPTLSQDGTRLLVPTSAGAEVWDLATGDVAISVGYPDGFQNWDFTSWSWLDLGTVLLVDGAGGWRIDLETAEAQAISLPTGVAGWAVDPEGVVVQPGEVPGLGMLLRVVASADQAVGTVLQHDVGGPNGRFVVAVVDRDDLSVRHVLPVTDFEGNYSNWALRPVAMGADGEVLLWVAVPGRDALNGWRLVVWEPASGDLGLVATSDDDPTTWTMYASDLFGGS